LGVPVVRTIGNKGLGKKELRQAVHSTYSRKDFAPFRLDYGETLEPVLTSLEEELSGYMHLMEHYSARWLAVKLMEGDSEVRRLVRQHYPENADILEKIEHKREKFFLENQKRPEKVIAQSRYNTAEKILGHCVRKVKVRPKTFTDRIDKVVCGRISGPVILAMTLFALYELAIVYGYKLTEVTWPFLASARDFIVSFLPSEGFISDPLWRAMPLGVVDGIIAVLNYVPIFVILFALIAILEDTGYMARMAFILDRIFGYFGLHGHSVLPMILGGVCVGGCAIPGVMACRAIKDEKSRLATILIMPLMNCLAKIPLYLLLIGMFFGAYKGLMMFFISTITIIIALAVAKVLNLTVLRKKPPAPFILEMPAYHLPTVRGVMGRCIERVWLFIKKIITVVAIVAALVYMLINYPGLNGERADHYRIKADQAIQVFQEEVKDNGIYAGLLAGDGLMRFVTYQGDYKKVKMGAKTKEVKEVLDKRFCFKNPDFFKITKKGKYKVNDKKMKDKNAAEVSKAYKKLDKVRKRLRRERREEILTSSYLGKAGRWFEPVTRFSGFNWRVNIALLSSFAAKENSVATLGSIYQAEPGDGDIRLEDRMKGKETGWTPLHALALMLFMAMYPPCIPTLLMIKVETGSTKWAFFAAIYPIILGLGISMLIFTGGGMLGLSGLQAMAGFYVLALVVTTAMAFVKGKSGFGY
ncbi:MAG: ferrous iron transporter B, partial [Candidatus Omnitrophica bacterium]|nr:ferrous iron transporter B [Candidatus Omnitrophota bacterium]